MEHHAIEIPPATVGGHIVSADSAGVSVDPALPNPNQAVYERQPDQSVIDYETALRSVIDSLQTP